MSIFSMIQDRVLETARQAQQLQQPQPDMSAAVLAGMGAGVETAAGQVDVEQALENISQQKGNPGLNWRTSIVDLMKLLDLDSSLGNRAELATELGYQGEKNGSAEMNIWLHRRVMEELEKGGGRVPESLKG
jgi:hypothetical protein